MQRTPHLVIWDDQHAAEQTIDAAEMMQRLARVLSADYKEKTFRGEPRYELQRFYPGGFELSIVAGHIYDDREVLSLAIELRAAAMAQPLTSVHLSNGVQRVKASQDTAWLRARNGTIVIVGAGIGGIVEVQN
ncbi:MAG: hypothetical protein JOZ51_28055 [Chloroflexi bacterium]|nr:hypothetical protein [Chloroflexota bacterium]